MVETGAIAVVHIDARVADGPDAGAVIETTDVDVAHAEGTYDPHRDYMPLEFRVGANDVPPAVDELVRDLAVGEERTVTVEPARAFGERDETAVVTVDAADLAAKSDREVTVGAPIRAETGEIGWVTAVDDDDATIDFNHEFAGDRVTFRVRLLDVHTDDNADADDPDVGSSANPGADGRSEETDGASGSETADGETEPGRVPGESES